jgi:hypothetical protein
VSRALLVLALLCVSCKRPEARTPAAGTEPPVRCVNAWTRVSPTLEYRMLNCTADGFDLHLVRADPRAIDAVVRPGSTAQTLGVPFALNANFFDENYRPLGIVRSEGRDLNGLHPVSWQSIFYVTKEGKPGIVRTAEWEEVRKEVRTAVQAGPRLVVDGAKNDVAKAKPDLRAGVCIDRQGAVIFFATPPEAAFDVHRMVDLAAGPLGCRDAMLFDGGPSVQLQLGSVAQVEGDKRVPAYVIAR